MKCEDCNRFERCEIILKMENLRYEIHSSRKKLQAILDQSPKEVRDHYKEQQKQLTNRRLELRRKQLSCFKRRWFIHYHIHPCFKIKKFDKEKRNTEDNQNQRLDSYF